MRNTIIATSASLAFVLSTVGALAQGRILTSVDDAKKTAAATGRPILAIAGKKT